MHFCPDSWHQTVQRKEVCLSGMLIVSLLKLIVPNYREFNPEQQSNYLQSFHKLLTEKILFIFIVLIHRGFCFVSRL